MVLSYKIDTICIVIGYLKEVENMQNKINRFIPSFPFLMIKYQIT